MTISDYTNMEMKSLYKTLSEKNPLYKEEILSAIKQKQSLNKHIFDVLATRGVIGYSELYESVKETLMKIDGAESRILFDKTSSDIFVSENGYYIEDDEGKKAVDIKYMVYARELTMEDSLPIVIVAKDIHHTFMIKREHNRQGNNDMNFTMTDIVKEAITRGTSDIHFKYSNATTDYTVLFKIHGSLRIQEKFTMNQKKSDDFFNLVRQKMALDTKTGFKSHDYNMPQGGLLKYRDLGVDLRGQFTPSGMSDKKNLFVCRIIKKDGGTKKTIDDLQGYDDIFKEILWRVTTFTKGLVLFTGVTNSGKSTTTSSMINSIPLTKSIATAEDPIEYDKSRRNTTQHQVFLSDDKSISVDFLSYVKSWKRSDQDVTEIGEIRKDDDGGNKLMQAVVEGVKAGNLTISTTHIDSSFDVALAMVDMYEVEKYLVSEILVFVSTQVLVEKLCPHCKIDDIHKENNAVLADWDKKGDVKFAWKKDLERFLEDDIVTKKRNPNGCPHCDHTGIIGLTPVYEYYKPDVSMITWLHENFDNVNRFGIEYEFCSKEDPYLAKNKLSCYIDKLRAGEVDADIEVISKTLQ